MENEQQSNAEKGGDELARKASENDSIILPETKTSDQSLQELTSLIQGVLQQTQDRFQRMSDQIIGRIDDMTRRIDELEKNITDLMTQAGVEPEP
uniref:Heat shock factor-binding protein 1 n=1 Tax=Elaeophora elaphi TaxID=1147741 RepID=A0A0R3S1C3_9BILA